MCSVIKTCGVSYEITVAHLPREVSRSTKFLLDLGYVIKATLSSTHYRRSPLFQGGQDIVWFVTVAMLGIIRNHPMLGCSKALVNALYCKPKDEVVIVNLLKRTVQSLDDANTQKKD